MSSSTKYPGASLQMFLYGGPMNSSYLRTVLWLVITVFSAKLLWRKWRKDTQKSLTQQFPGPKPYPIVGSLLDKTMRVLISEPTRQLLGALETILNVYGKVAIFWMMDEPKMLISDTELVIRLYNQGHLQDKSTEVMRDAKLVGGEGLLALPSKVHSQRRSQWMPGFTRKQVEHSIRFFNQQAARLCNELQTFEESGKVFDLVPLSIGCTFRAICYSAFGEEYMSKLPDSVGSEHMHCLHTISFNLTTRALQPWMLLSDFIYFKLTPAGRDVSRAIKKGHILTKQAVKDRRMHNRLLESSSNYQKPESSEDFECFLDHLLVLMDKGELTESEVIQELNVFIAAGYDTSGLTVSYTLYLLSLHPEHQEEIVRELCNIMPPENWHSVDKFQITALMTKRMRHLDMCIKEALRLFSTLPVSPRRTTHDVVLKDGRVIPANMDVFVTLYLIHRDPNYFPQPDEFIPERHLRPNRALMPFAIGSRNCIGQQYATYEMKVVLAYLLMSYKWETTEKPNISTLYQTLLVPENGLHFKITKRSFPQNL